MTDLNFSARSYERILKVARSFATNHLLEALSYRNLDRRLWS
jgi:magnesium chelatase family protein